MSLLTEENRLSVKLFAAVPALLDLPEIQRQPASVSNVSSRLSSMRGSVDLEEGCLITKDVKYTHQLAYMVNAVRSRDPQPIVSQKFQEISLQVLKLFSLQQDVLELDLKVIPYERFTLNNPCNLTLRKSESTSSALETHLTLNSRIICSHVTRSICFHCIGTIFLNCKWAYRNGEIRQ
jgi:hypothetical protein